MFFSEMKIRNRKAHQIITDIFYGLKEQYRSAIYVEFIKNMATGNGEHAFNERKRAVISIGCPMNFENIYNKNRRNDCISLSDFVKMLVTAYHEARHIIQQELFYDESMRDNTCVKKMAIQHVGMAQNNYFYHMDYSHNLCEIDAEKHGLRNAFLALKDLYNEDIAADAIKLLVKECINASVHTPSFFGIAYDNDVNRIFQSFESRFNDEISNKSMFIYRDAHLDDYKIEDDVFYKHLIDSPENQLLYHADRFQTGWQQLELVIAINKHYASRDLAIEHGHILENDPILDYCDMCHKEQKYGLEYFEKHPSLLSPESIINKQQKRSFPVKQKSELNKWIEEMVIDRTTIERKNEQNLEIFKDYDDETR